MIPYGKHYIDEDDISAVVEVLRHGSLTQGCRVDSFEEHFAAHVGAKYAVAVSSGTAALHLTCLAAGVRKGDNVVTSANTFVASANCAVFEGASIEFTDIDAHSLNMSVQDLMSRCQHLTKVKAIIPVHFAGLPCDMAAIKTVSDQYGSILIEDACHALGSAYACGEKVGSCKYSDMTVFSFHPVKAIAAGEGGMITTNNRKLYESLIKLRSHGIIHQKLLGDFEGADIERVFASKQEAFEDGKLNPWYFEMQDLGYNYRLTEIQCELARSQLMKLNRFVSYRKDLVRHYDNCFEDLLNLSCTQYIQREQSSHHLYVVRINFTSIGIKRGDFMRRLMKEGVGSQVHYIPVPMHPYYRLRGFNISDYPETEKYYREALSLPLFFGLTKEQQDLVVRSIKSLL